MNWLEEKLVFRSKTLAQNHSFEVKNIKVSELRYDTPDGANLHGISVLPENPEGVILYFHGNKGNVQTWLEWAEKMAKSTHREVVMMDYRGYGKSTGERKMDKMLADVGYFYHYCSGKYKTEQIVIFGRSLGGAFASYCATYFPCKFLVLESTFTSLENVLKYHSRGITLKENLDFPFESISKVKKFKFPVYIIHGDDDGLIPFEMSQELFEAIPSAEKKHYRIADGGHNNLHTRAEYWEIIEEVFE